MSDPSSTIDPSADRLGHQGYPSIAASQAAEATLMRGFTTVRDVGGNPLENLDLVADPWKNFVVIMKNGKIYKNTL